MAKKIALDLEIKSTSVGEATKKTTSLRTEIRNLREQMASGELKGEAFTEAAKRAAAMQDQMDKVNKTVKTLANDNKRLDAFVSTAQGIAGGFAAAQGAAALFGSENEDLQKTMVKLQASMTLLNGVQQVSNLLRKEGALNTVLLGNANATATASTNTLTKAQKALRVSFIALGIGALVVGIGMLIANFDKVKKAVLDFIPGLSRVADFFTRVKNAVTDFIGVTSDSTRAIDIYKKSFEALNDDIEYNIQLLKAQGATEQEIRAERKRQVMEEFKYLNMMQARRGYLTDVEQKRQKELNIMIAALNTEANNEQLGKEAKREADAKKHGDNMAKVAQDNAAKRAAAEAVDVERRLMLIQDEETRELALLQNKHTIQQEEAKKNGQTLLTLLALQSQEETALRDKFEQQRKDKVAEIAAKEIADKAKSDKAALEASIISENDNFLKTLENRQKLLDLEREQALTNKELTAGELLKIEAQYTASSNALSKERTDKEEADERAKNEAILAAKEAFTNQSISILASLSNLARDNSKTQKALALTAIGVDTGAAIGSAVRNSQANPANAVTGGLAGALQFGTSLAQILSGAAQAKRVLQGGQVRGAGASAGSARTSTELQPPTQINRDIQVQDRGGNGQRVFVLENDITTTQDRVGRIRANSVID
jgi:hypothetical protein